MIDVIIPTMLELYDPRIQSLITEVRNTSEVNLIVTCTKASASANRNIGLDASKSDIVIMIDDDITGLPVGWAEALEHVIRTQDNCVMVSPQLFQPDGAFGFMMGVRKSRHSGLSTAAGILPTACIAIWANGIRFDENFIGSGFEDNDYCAQLRLMKPDGRFLVAHDVHVIHRNEAKNQHGIYWDHNKAYFHNKWDKEQ